MTRRSMVTLAAIALVCAYQTGAPTHVLATEVWATTGTRFVVLHADQRATGLAGVDGFFGVTAGVERRHLGIDLEIMRGGASQQLGLNGVDDPVIDLWTVSGAVHVRPVHDLPFELVGRVGAWHFDYRDSAVELSFPGLDPILVTFDDFTEPTFSVGAAASWTPWRNIRLRTEAGMIGLHLNEATLEADGLELASRWRMSPTAAVSVGFGR